MLLRLIAILALAMPVVAQAAALPMLIATSRHFKVYAAESEADLRVRVNRLERFDAVLRRLTNTRDVEQVVPLTVYVLPGTGTMEAGANVLGYYSPGASGAFAVVPQKIEDLPIKLLPQMVLFHEYAHHFMLQNSALLYSPWFVEGFAEFYSTTEIVDDKVTVGKSTPLRVSTLATRWTYPLARLVAPGERPMTGEQTDQLYARAWLLVHYLTLVPQRAGQLDAYLRARAAGQSEEQAFQTAFHASIPAIDKELKAYFDLRRMSFLALTVPGSSDIAVRPATASEVAMTRLTRNLRGVQYGRDALGETSKNEERGWQKRRAQSLAYDARVAQRKLPDDPALQVMVAQAELLNGKPVEARAAAEIVLRQQPKNPYARLVLAEIMLASAAPGDKAAVAAARREIVIANRAAPDDPVPLIAYYQSFADRGEAAPAIAIEGLERAQQLAPQDDGVRLMLAREDISRKNFVAAAQLLRPVAFAPHAGPRRDAARALLKTLPGVHEAAPAAVGTASGTGNPG